MRKFFFILAFFPVFLKGQAKEILLSGFEWNFRKAGDKEWMKATVPGNVYTDLHYNNKIAGPFSPGEEEKTKWVAESDWEYRTSFNCAAQDLLSDKAELVFEGLDTYADVFLNDSLLFHADNMFRVWRIDVRRLLKLKSNSLMVKFTSALRTGREAEANLPYKLPEGVRVFTRKAQYQYGWDFAPAFPGCGIWRSVKLLCWNSARISNIHFGQDSLKSEMAFLNFNVEVDCAKEGDYHIELSCKEKPGTNSTFNTPVNRGRENNYDVPFKVSEPKLWWCNGMGKAELYHFTAKLFSGKKILDERDITIGLRTIEPVREKEQHGESFYFKLNGKAVFMKGANVVPLDVFPDKVKSEQYAELIKAATRAHMNMLRVWGGGIYPDEKFYSLCDEKGILVWQDFMFACAMYPGTKNFLRNVGYEISDNVKRLRNHPSLALWCGNNETDEGWKNWGWQKQFKYSEKDSVSIYNDYKNLFEKLIPDSLHYLDPQRAYIPTSPEFGWGRKESLQRGDSHYWGVWWGLEPVEMYNKKVGRFMSEYGMQAIPLSFLNNAPDTTFKKMFPYQKHPRGFETITHYIRNKYKSPKSTNDYIYLTQLMQADALSTAIEAHRRNKPACMGSLFWQLNDCWPGITWSTLDYALNKKAGWYAAAKAFEPLLLSIVKENDSLKIYAISDLSDDVNGTLQIEICDFDGKSLSKKGKPVTIPAGQSKILDVFRFPNEIPANNSAVKITLASKDKSISKLFYPSEPKDLSLTKPTFRMNLKKNVLILSANTLARNVLLTADGYEFDENYFDLFPGEVKQISFKKIKPFAGKPVIKVRSLVDTY